MKLVIYPEVEEERAAAIRAAAGGMEVVNASDEAAARAAIVEAEAFYGKMTPALLAAATRLQWVQSPTASLEHYLFPALIEHPCTLTNMRGLYGDVVADHAMALVLCLARNLHQYVRQQTRAEWNPAGAPAQATPEFTMGQSVVTPSDRAHVHLGACTLGIVGLGSIGAGIADRAHAFGMRVIAVDPVRTERPAAVEALWPIERLDDLLGESDFVVVAAPHTPRTEGMFTRARFRKMRASAHFINIGRGAIVSLDDLVASLELGELAGAGLDVYEIEPLPPEHPLWRMENVVLTPHVGSASVVIAERHLETLLDNVGRFSRSEPLRNITRKAEWF